MPRRTVSLRDEPLLDISSEVSEILAAHGQRELAEEIKQFVGRMPPPRTDREMIAEELRKCHREAQAREGPSR